jgi:hypothetical protein
MCQEWGSRTLCSSSTWFWRVSVRRFHGSSPLRRPTVLRFLGGVGVGLGASSKKKSKPQLAKLHSLVRIPCILAQAPSNCYSSSVSFIINIYLHFGVFVFVLPGLKILCVCFDTELSTEWSRTVRVIHDLGTRTEGSAALWDFLEFVVTVRTSIYPMFRPFINQKVKVLSGKSEYGNREA